MKRGLITVLAALSLTLSACGALDKEAQYRVAARELAADMATMNSLDGQHWPQIDPNTKATGEAGEFARRFKGFIIKVVQDRKGYRTEMDALHFEQVVEPAALASSGGLQRAATVIAAGRAITEKYRALNRQHLADVRRDMTAVAPDSAVIKSFQQGFDRGMGAGAGPMDKVFADELKIFDEYAALVGDLGHTHGRWQASGDQFMFANDDDLDAFRNHMEAIQSAAADERLVVATNQGDQTRRVEQLNDMSGR